MEIKVLHKNAVIKNDTINVILEYDKKTEDISHLIDYIKAYKGTVIVKNNNEFIKIHYSDIRYFYCKDKEIYCKTKDKEYKIKSRLYELEKLNKDFIRVSKKYIVNFNYAKHFDLSRIGTILIRLDNDDVITVSRRKIRDVLEYLEERSI